MQAVTAVAVGVGGAVIVEGVRAMTALASVVLACTGSSINSHCTQSTGTNGLTDTAGAVAGFSVFLAAAAHQFRSARTNQGALQHVTAVMRMVLMAVGFFANVDHAVITAVVLVSVTATARNRVLGAQIAAGATVIVFTGSTVAMIVVWILVAFGAAHQVIFRFTGTGV
jgi:hypothetical protein